MRITYHYLSARKYSEFAVNKKAILTISINPGQKWPRGTKGARAGRLAFRSDVP